MKIRKINYNQNSFFSPQKKSQKHEYSQKFKKEDLFKLLTNQDSNSISKPKSYVKTLLCFSFYDYFYNKVYVSDSKIASQAGISREWENITKHVLQNDGLLAIENRGANRTCITKVLLNLFYDPELIYFLSNEIKALSGVFQYHFTRFLKISYMYLTNKLFNIKNKNEDGEFLSQFSKIWNNGRYSQLKEAKFTLKQEICLGVFPLSAIEWSLSMVEAYPLKIRNKFSFLRYLCTYYCKRHDIKTLQHLSSWLYKVLKIRPERGMIKDIDKGYAKKQFDVNKKDVMKNKVFTAKENNISKPTFYHKPHDIKSTQPNTSQEEIEETRKKYHELSKLVSFKPLKLDK